MGGGTERKERKGKSRQGKTEAPKTRDGLGFEMSEELVGLCLISSRTHDLSHLVSDRFKGWIHSNYINTVSC